MAWVLDGRKIINYDRSEWKMTPSKVNPKLIFLVDELTTYVKSVFSHALGIIHVAFENTGHEVGSQHYVGNAVDLHFHGVSLMDQYFCAERYPFIGIGVYPYWKRPGLHLDVRPQKLDDNRGERWWRNRDGDYLDLDSALIRELSGNGRI